jgi:heavy metal sensor kinase
LTLWYSLVLTVVLAIFALAIAWQQARIGLRRVDDELDDMTTTLVSLLRDELGENPTPEAAAIDVQQTITSGRHVAIATDDGRLLASDDLGAVLVASRLAVPPSAQHWAVTAPDNRWRVGGRRERIGNQGYLLLAATPLDTAWRERHESLEAMWVGIPVLLVLAAAGGFWLAWVGLRPLTDMALRAAQLSVDGTDDLGRSDRDDEIGRLEQAFNDLLARLRLALSTQRQFMADASHELRTPMAVVRSVTDVTLDRPHRDEAEYREALGMVGTQTRRASRMIEDMLMLARADGGGYPLRPVSLYLDEVVGECRDALRTMARERGVRLDVSSPGEVPFVGDEDLLRRMTLNLLQNAIQHTRDAGRVHATVERSAHAITIAVSDEGPGVPEADRERIFDRFVQLDPARRQAGAGLGLPIARWIAEAHGGRIEVRGAAGAGSTFVVLLPAA